MWKLCVWIVVTLLVLDHAHGKLLAKPSTSLSKRTPSAHVHQILPLARQAALIVSSSPTNLKGSESVHTMTLTNLVVNIVADLCPHGMMPLAFGIAQGETTGWVVAVALLVTFGTMSAYTMISYAEMAKTTNAKDIGQIWSKLINERTEWVVDLSIFLLCFGCCVFYSAFIGDIFTSLISAMGITGLLAQRPIVLLTITGFVLLPLCQLEDLSALKFSSLVGTGGILYTAAFHALRLLDGSYAHGSEMLSHVPPKMLPTWPRQPLQPWRVGTGTLILINMLCVAFLAHYNSINYFEELENPSAERYSRAVATGFGVSMVVFVGMMFMGYQLFGLAAQPLLLNNFPLWKDPLAILARAATGLAITFAYPLMFAGLKSSLYSMIDGCIKPPELPKPPKWNFLASLKPQPPQKPVSERLPAHIKQRSVLAAVGVITAIAVQCGEEDVSVVLGLVGSVLGCFAAYVLPGMLKIALQKQRTEAGLSNSRLEVVANHGLVVMGLVFGALGVWITLKTEVDKLRSGGGHHGH